MKCCVLMYIIAQIHVPTAKKLETLPLVLAPPPPPPPSHPINPTQQATKIASPGTDTTVCDAYG